VPPDSLSTTTWLGAIAGTNSALEPIPASSDWNARTRLHNVHREEDRAGQLDREKRQRSRAERPPLAREERVEGILSQRTRGAASRSRERREASIWTQMDPSSGSGATGISKSELKNQELVVGARGFEPRTSCAQGSCRKSISLVRLALFYVMVHGF
jgi:hypothetical protein